MRFWDMQQLNAELFGKRIRQAREKKGLSQEDFATMIARDQRAVSEYEHGKRRVAVTDLPTLAQALDVPMLYFFEGEMTPHDLDYAMLEQFHRLPTDEAKRYAVEMIRLFSEAITS